MGRSQVLAFHRIGACRKADHVSLGWGTAEHEFIIQLVQGDLMVAKDKHNVGATGFCFFPFDARLMLTFPKVYIVMVRDDAGGQAAAEHVFEALESTLYQKEEHWTRSLGH